VIACAIDDCSASGATTRTCPCALASSGEHTQAGAVDPVVVRHEYPHAHLALFLLDGCSMRARLVYNPSAGDEQHSAEAMIRGLEQLGYRVAFDPDYDRDRVDALVRDEALDLVLAAGGDGTLGAAALALAGRATPLAIVPLGTANNIGHTFGLHGRDPVALIAGLRRPSTVRVDVGCCRAGDQTLRFIESAGAGIVHALLGDDEVEAHKEPSAARGLLADRLRRYRAPRWRVRLDDRALDEEWLFLDAMNIPYLGPRLRMAPDADPTDGWLDVAYLRASDREAAIQALERAERHDAPVELPLRTERCRRLALEAPSLRVDDRPAPLSGPFAISVDPGAVTLWLPSNMMPSSISHSRKFLFRL
jgi:diacylglycerol kinase family enzyme